MSSLAQAPSPEARARTPAVPRALTFEWVPVAVLTLAALVLRASQLHQSLLGDEVFTYQDIVGHTFRQVLTTVNTGGENSPPLFFLLAWGAAHFGDASVLIRLPSVVLGSAVVPVLYLLGREVGGRRAGLVAAGLYALAPFPVFYGIEARPYATMTFFVALSTFALLRAVATRRRGWWLLYALAATAAAYTHYTSIFVLAVQAAWSLWVCRRRVKPAALSAALIAILYLPWLPHLRGKALAVIGRLYPLGLDRVLSDLLRPIPGHPAAPLRAIPTLAGLAVFGLVVAAGLLCVARGRPALTLRSPRLLTLALMVATPVGLLLYSLLDTDLWLPRGLSASIPAAAVVLGLLVAALPRPLAALAATAMAVTLVAGTLRSFGPAYNRGPYRAIAAYLDRVATPRDPVVLGTFVGAGPLAEQFRRAHAIVSLRSLWSRIGAGATGYLVLDELIAAHFHLRATPPAGYVMVAHRHWGGGEATDVYAYRRRPA